MLLLNCWLKCSKYIFRFRCQSGSSVSRISHSIDTQLLHPVHLFLIWAPSWAKWLETQNYHSSILQNNPLHADIYSIDEKSFEFVTKAAGLTLNPSKQWRVKCLYQALCRTPSSPLDSVKATEIEAYALPTLLMPLALKKKKKHTFARGVCMQCQ